MNEMQIFKNEEFGPVRALTLDGEPWFVGKDVAAVLGYGEGKSLANAVANHVDGEDKGVTEVMTPGGKQKMVIINESGLYSLILSSRLPAAKRFKHWVTAEVLPAIRRHGVYAVDEVLANPDMLISALQALKEERAKSAALEGKIETDKPKVLFADAVSASKTSILVGELAKILKQNGVEMGQNRLFAWMRDNGYLIKRQGTDHNMPTQSSMERGLFEIKETVINSPDGSVRTVRTTKVTGAGQQYFINLFLKEKAGEEADKG